MYSPAGEPPQLLLLFKVSKSHVTGNDMIEVVSVVGVSQRKPYEKKNNRMRLDGLLLLCDIVVRKVVHATEA
jgi:hypothetical protein